MLGPRLVRPVGNTHATRGRGYLFPSDTRLLEANGPSATPSGPPLDPLWTPSGPPQPKTHLALGLDPDI
eukprot:1192673-Prorocentrum_minimum.AAC.1